MVERIRKNSSRDKLFSKPKGISSETHTNSKVQEIFKNPKFITVIAKAFAGTVTGSSTISVKN